METITAGDLRAEVARRRVRLYELAAKVQLHPGHLGAMLRERRPIPAPFAQRLLEALEDLAPVRGGK